MTRIVLPTSLAAEAEDGDAGRFLLAIMKAGGVRDAVDQSLTSRCSFVHFLYMSSAGAGLTFADRARWRGLGVASQSRNIPHATQAP